MASIGGRRRNLGSERWITYHAVFTTDGERVFYDSLLSDEVGLCGEIGGKLVLPAGVTADEAVRATVCLYIDTHEVPPGRPPVDEYWALKHILHGGRL